MELIKSIIDLIISFFNNSTVKKKEEIGLADAKENAVINEIKASTNAKAIDQVNTTQQALNHSYDQHREEIEENQHKTIDEKIEDRFGSDW